MPGTKTDNDFTRDKIALRANHSPWPKDRPLKVLDCFGGHGVVWRGVELLVNKSVSRHAIDNRHDLMEFHFHGDNLKIMAGLDLAQYDVVDLDSYGIPTDQISEVLQSGFKGTVFVTAIQSHMGMMPAGLIADLGIPGAITKKAPSLVARRGWEYFCEWLYIKGVTEIIHRSKRRKHYLCFQIQ